MHTGKRRWVVGTCAASAALVAVVAPTSLLARATPRTSAATADARPVANVAAPASSSTGAAGVSFSAVSPGEGSQPSVSSTGERVVYVAAPGTPDGRTSSVWLDDRTAGQATELTLPNPNVRIGDSRSPVISADGCVVAVTTQISYDLFRDDDLGNRWDVYRTTLPACGGAANEWTLVSTRLNQDGIAEARGDVNPDQPIAMSGSGTVMAYVHPMAPVDEVDRGTVLPNAIEVVDLGIPVDDPAHAVTAPGLPPDVSASDVRYSGMTRPVLTADGGTLVFQSDATSQLPVPEWNPLPAGASAAPTQVFAWNRTDADPFTATSLISAAGDGVANGSSTDPAVSGDGRFVAFSSNATNLVGSPDFQLCGAACPAQVYVVDRDTDLNQVFDEAANRTVMLVSSLAVTGDEGDPADDVLAIGNGASFAPTMSADGNTVAFASQATNLLQVQTPGGGDAGDGDIISADLSTHRLRRTFDLPAPTPGAYSHPQLSANSRVLVADSLFADRLVGDPALTGRRIVAATYVPSITMADLDLGTVYVDQLGPEWRVSVINDGPGTFSPTQITTDNPDFAISGGTCGDQAPVIAGQSCEVRVTFKPSVAGPASATLTVAEEGFGAITLTAHLSGSGGEPALLAKPAAQDFGTSVVGEMAAEQKQFDVYNIYFDPIAVTSVTIGGANAPDFAVDASECLASTALQTTVIQTEITTPPTTAPPATTAPANTTSNSPTNTPTGDPAGAGAPAADTTPPTTTPAGDGGSGTTETSAPVETTPTTAPVETAPTTPASTPPPATILPSSETKYETQIVTETVSGVGANASCAIKVTFTPSGAGVRSASVNIGSSVDQYTSMLVSGVGVYAPKFSAPASATPGRTIDVGGTGYPARTPVVVGWSDGGSATVEVVTDDRGNFLTTFPVDRTQRAGSTSLVAQVANGPSASATVDVERVRRRANGARD